MVTLARSEFDFTIIDFGGSLGGSFVATSTRPTSSFTFTNSAGYNSDVPHAVFKADLVRQPGETILADKRIVYTWDTSGPHAGTGELKIQHLALPASVVKPLGRGESLVVDDLLIFRDFISGKNATAKVTIRVTGANDAPTANDDHIKVLDTVRVVTLRPLNNDDDPDRHDELSITSVKVGSLPLNGLPDPGTATWTDEKITLVLDPVLLFLRKGESIDFSIQYRISDGNGGRDSAFMHVHVIGTDNAVINGTPSANYLVGEPDADRMNGLGGNDRIDGRDGNDKLDGGAGNDFLIGGLGKDYLRGSGGADRFDFNKILETTTGSGRDLILDFSRAQKDKIDLSTIDADSDSAGNQKFTFIGTAGFHGKDGELRCAGGVIQGDVDGDKVADFEIKVNVATLLSSDFIL